MLSVPGSNPPKKVTVKIARAENLELSQKEGKKKFNSKFKISILGGKHKEHTSLVDDAYGKPTWNVSCSIKLHRQQIDPICLLVEDSEGHHKGQVIIPVVKIKPRPYTYSSDQDPAQSNNLLCSELEPTAKNSNPRGYLLYWIWIEEYYTEDEMADNRKSFNKSMQNIFGSKSRLSGSKSNLGDSNADSINRLGSVSELNKPVKHHKSSSLLKLKFPKKKDKGGSTTLSSMKKSDQNLSDSDVDNASNMSFPHSISNPFDKGGYGDGDYIGGSNSGFVSSIGVHDQTLHHVKNNHSGSIGNGSLESGSIFIRTPSSSSAATYSQQQQHQHQYSVQQPVLPTIPDPPNYSDPFKNASPTSSMSEKNLCPFLDPVPSNPVYNKSTNDSGVGDPFKDFSSTPIVGRDRNSNELSHHEESNPPYVGGMNFLIPSDTVPYKTQKASPIDSNQFESATTNINRTMSPALSINYQQQKPHAPAPPTPQLPQSPLNISKSTASPRDRYDANNSLSAPNHYQYPSMSSNNSTNFIEQPSQNKNYEVLQKDYADIKKQNNSLKVELESTQSELKDVKDKLWNLRIKLLEAGATQFLEI